ncbi:hypothetical protein [Necropsobacter rosorum]|uniref:hypothetical protein n=1 Tax=Necropsobacter rosorum TaxID=908285 RepID=UPI003C7ED837
MTCPKWYISGRLLGVRLPAINGTDYSVDVRPRGGEPKAPKAASGSKGGLII